MNTAIATPPTRMTEAEAERICRMGPHTGACERARGLRADYVKWEAERDREETRLRTAREAKQAAEAKARADAREAERAAAMEALKAGLRDRFFRGNPEASEMDYQRVEQRMLDDELVRRAAADRDVEVAALRARGGYGL